MIAKQQFSYFKNLTTYLYALKKIPYDRRSKHISELAKKMKSEPIDNIDK